MVHVHLRHSKLLLSFHSLRRHFRDILYFSLVLFVFLYSESIKTVQMGPNQTHRSETGQLIGTSDAELQLASDKVS